MFKIGDKVRLFQDVGSRAVNELIFGKIYTVSDVDGEPWIKIQESSLDWWYLSKGFQPAEDVMENKNYESACKVIDGMTVICGDGKKEVKKLVASILGVEVKEERTYQMGDVYRQGDQIQMVASNDHGEMISITLLSRSMGGKWGGEHGRYLQVNEIRRITPQEMRTITGGEFTYIGHASDVLKVIEP